MKTNTAHTLALAAAFAGLLGGTSTRLNAQSTQQTSNATVTASSNAGVLGLAQDNPPAPSKHSCKGKGGCATDGSKPPKAV